MEKELLRENKRLKKLLEAAYNALRSYQYRNQSTELAEEIANEIEKEIASSLRFSQ